MGATANEEIGRCTCPVCHSPNARLRISAKQLVYVTCNTCNSQTFSRSDRSDELLRARHKAEAPPAPVATALAPAPVPPVLEPVRTNVSAVRTQPPPTHKHSSWGFESWSA